jgi:hypothetical protein
VIPTDPLLEQHDAGNSSSEIEPEEGSGSGKTVGDFFDNLRFSFLLLIFLLFGISCTAELVASSSIANAARDRVLTPT